MKSTIKLLLVVILFSSAAFAEGEMGTGGRSCPNGQTTCFAGNDEPTGDIETKTTETDASTDSILTSVQGYLKSVFEYFEN